MMLLKHSVTGELNENRFNVYILMISVKVYFKDLMFEDKDTHTHCHFTAIFPGAPG